MSPAPVADERKKVPRWRPFTARHPGNISGATFGLILAASVIAASGEQSGEKAGYVALFTLGTLMIFWLSDVYATVLERWTEDGRPPTRGEVRDALAHEWPMVSAAFLPLGFLLLGVLDVSADTWSIEAALIVCIVELSGTAWFAAARAGAGPAGKLVSTAVALTLGIALIVLKSALH